MNPPVYIQGFLNYIQILRDTLGNSGRSSVLLALFFGLAPAIFWLWFWLQEDKEKPEPMQMILKTFVIGGFSVIIAFFLEHLIASGPNVIGDFHRLLAAQGLRAALVALWPILAWAFVEEGVKYAAAYVAAFRKHHFDEPVDAMIYMITAALGFAAVENFLFLLSTAINDGSVSNSFLFTGNLRFLGATLLHTVTSATLGAFIGFSFYKSSALKRGTLILGLIAATALHTLFNFFIIINRGKNIFNVLISLWVITTFVIFVFEIIKKVNVKKITPAP